ncbi:MAG: hypothetical protein II208_02560 [Alphaproteobacteria bacterium]|nr:hypothetical protein [Alphaproteobacteria bacterium]
MIKDEYLNPEFMYKFINSWCRAENWIMYDFTFGKLKYKGRIRPAVFRNQHGYNMVYRFKIYKLPYDVNMLSCVRDQDLEDNMIWADVYFDIMNETLVEHDGRVLSFNEFPESFKLGDKYFYGVYGQPKFLKQHYSNARDCKNLDDYMRVMDIKAQNLFDVNSLFCNVLPRNRQELFPLRFFFKSGQDATKSIRFILNEPYDCKDFVRMERVWSAYKMHKQDKDFFRLHIHNPEFPVFYTDNAMEVSELSNDSVKLSLDGALNISDYLKKLSKNR